MPLYEYRCDACGHRFEKIQKFSDPLIDQCPACGEKRVQKLVSSPAIQFKGTGWYITDYAKKNTVDAAKSEADSKAADSKSGDSKSAESKSGDAKSGESKSSDAKSSDARAPDSKSSETKSSVTKPATTSS